MIQRPVTLNSLGFIFRACANEVIEQPMFTAAAARWPESQRAGRGPRMSATTDDHLSTST